MLANNVLQYLSILGIIFTGYSETSVKVTQLPESASTNMGTNISFHCTLPFFQDGPPVKVYWWKEVPPTLLKITSQEPKQDPSASLTVVCTTSPFYPENISIVWYKDGTRTSTGINQIIERNTDGLYEASSQLQETHPVLPGTIYTCLVSHSTLHFPATYIATYLSTDRENISHSLLISRCAWGGFVFLMVAFIIGMQCHLKRIKTDADAKAPYVAIPLTDSKHNYRDKL
ncbi:SMH class II histocompatibility antigen, beta-1 chain-like isoform X3 [Heterodontus francisci]|uniref:SMH class II histocompatibility antigen, beta-1 chain-like isoform X3 n=1 Tax=Heterodontus francisci TaxID=7792 RepID=UPI00355B6233